MLPGGLFPSETYGSILSAAGKSHSCLRPFQAAVLTAAPGRDDIDLGTRVANVRDIVHALPPANFELLKRIVEHLEKVTDYEESNQMTAESLSTVFAPNLLRSTNNDFGTFFSNMAAGHRVTKILISHVRIVSRSLPCCAALFPCSPPLSASYAATLTRTPHTVPHHLPRGGGARARAGGRGRDGRGDGVRRADTRGGRGGRGAVLADGGAPAEAAARAAVLSINLGSPAELSFSIP